jgi:hypothetical protein
VTEQSIDPPGFRVRTFARDWLIPLVDRAAREPYTGDPMGPWALASALLDEAFAWIEAGQEVSYFADVELPEPTLRASITPSLVSAGYSPRDQEVFSRDLVAALDDLTPERREFLSLVCFEREEFFAARLDEVREVADILAERPWLTVPPRAVDRISWALNGAALPGFSAGPASWRFNFDVFAGQVPVTAAGVTTVPSRRRREVEEVRMKITSIVESYLEYQEAPQEFRRGLLTQPDTESGEHLLPPWARDLPEDRT